MRLAFLLVVLAGAIFYTYVAFLDLNFMTRSGRLGPGFFPRIVGVTAIVFILWAFMDALRDPLGEDASGEESRWRDAWVLMALAVFYAVLLRLFGGFPATVLYLAVGLSILNRGQLVRNAILSVVIPACVYLLFDTALNASMPPALFELPI